MKAIYLGFMVPLLCAGNLASAGEVKFLSKSWQSQKLRRHIPGEYVLSAVRGIPASELVAIFQFARPFTIEPLAHTSDTYLLKFSIDPGLESLRRKIRNSRKIKDLQPNYLYQAF